MMESKNSVIVVEYCKQMIHDFHSHQTLMKQLINLVTKINSNTYHKGSILKFIAFRMRRLLNHFLFNIIGCHQQDLGHLLGTYPIPQNQVLNCIDLSHRLDRDHLPKTYQSPSYQWLNQPRFKIVLTLQLDHGRQQRTYLSPSCQVPHSRRKPFNFCCLNQSFKHRKTLHRNESLVPWQDQP